MRHRLKSDHSVECEAVFDEPFHNDSWVFVTLVSNNHQFPVPLAIFDATWELVPEPPKPVLIEDELEAVASMDRWKGSGYPIQWKLRDGKNIRDFLTSGAAEIRRLRKECKNVRAVLEVTRNQRDNLQKKVDANVVQDRSAFDLPHKPRKFRVKMDGQGPNGEVLYAYAEEVTDADPRPDA